MADALTNMGTVVGQVVTIITGNDVLMTCFAASLLVVGAKVFKKIKKASAN